MPTTASPSLTRLVADAATLTRRRLRTLGLPMAILLIADLSFFAATGFPSPLGPLAALLLLIATTRSVVEGREVGLRASMATATALIAPILRTAAVGALVGLPLIALLGLSMAIDPQRAAIVSQGLEAGVGPVVAVAGYLIAVMAAPFASIPAQAPLYIGGLLWTAVCLHFLFVWQWTIVDGRGGVAAMRASVPMVRGHYELLIGAAIVVSIVNVTLALLAYLGLGALVLSIITAAFGGSSGLLFAAGGIALLLLTLPPLVLFGPFLLAVLFRHLRDVAA